MSGLGRVRPDVIVIVSERKPSPSVSEARKYFLDGDRPAAGGRRRSRRTRSGAKDGGAPTFLSSREEWRPRSFHGGRQGKKLARRCCASGDRDEAVLRRDHAIRGARGDGRELGRRPAATGPNRRSDMRMTGVFDDSLTESGLRRDLAKPRHSHAIAQAPRGAEKLSTRSKRKSAARTIRRPTSSIVFGMAWRRLGRVYRGR